MVCPQIYEFTSRYPFQKERFMAPQFKEIKIPLPDMVKKALECHSDKVYTCRQEEETLVIIGAHDEIEARETAEMTGVKYKEIRLWEMYDTSSTFIYQSLAYNWSGLNSAWNLALPLMIKTALRTQSDKVYKYYYNRADFLVIVGANNIEDAVNAILEKLLCDQRDYQDEEDWTDIDDKDIRERIVLWELNKKELS
jgi:hypothetical protein